MGTPAEAEGRCLVESVRVKFEIVKEVEKDRRPSSIDPPSHHGRRQANSDPCCAFFCRFRGLVGGDFCSGEDKMQFLKSELFWRQSQRCYQTPAEFRVQAKVSIQMGHDTLVEASVIKVRRNLRFEAPAGPGIEYTHSVCTLPGLQGGGKTSLIARLKAVLPVATVIPALAGPETHRSASCSLSKRIPLSLSLSVCVSLRLTVSRALIHPALRAPTHRPKGPSLRSTTGDLQRFPFDDCIHTTLCTAVSDPSRDCGIGIGQTCTERGHRTQVVVVVPIGGGQNRVETACSFVKGSMDWGVYGTVPYQEVTVWSGEDAIFTHRS
ncbi:hypothetical protein LIA77_06501 [Sarocladium implicatum]|nr:hypothetical protein LIA77_06501 [Sarocladium implicatum]